MFYYLRSQKGVSLYLSLMIMAIILAIGLGLATIFVSRLATLREIGHSVVSFYAADTGIEQILYLDEIRCMPPVCTTTDPSTIADFCTSDCSGLCSGFSTSTQLENKAEYEAKFSTTTQKEKIIQAVGTYKATRRGIKAIK